MERRGRIPVAKFRTQEGKTRSRSRVREPDYNEQDPETDLFTLLEDNIALKEENKALKLQIEEHKKIQNELLEDNVKMRDELEAMKTQQLQFEKEVKELSETLNKTNKELNALNKLHKKQVEKNETLTLELQQQQLANASLPVIFDSATLQSKLLKVLPSLNTNELESLIDVEATAATPITVELVERLLDEFLAQRNLMNAVELQLYEANEKISELLENQHHMEEENEAIRTENTNLTRVAKLLTENMKESVETSKKMEAALIKLKQRNEVLMAKSRDITDGQPDPDENPSPTTVKTDAEFEQIQKEVRSQNLDHGERIVEMRNLMETAIQKSTNDELKKLQLKLDILEEELRQALTRAEKAESELQAYRNIDSCHEATNQSVLVTTPPPPPLPPPPPPLPPTLLYKPVTLNLPKKFPATEEGSAEAVAAATSAVAHDSDKMSQQNLRKRNSGGDKIISGVLQQVQTEAATGLDALVREFKSGRVTLRRNRRKTRTNEALQEMFQVLEISEKQNRNSKICIDLHI